MGTERTLSIIKPDAVAKNVIGEIYSRFEKAGLKFTPGEFKPDLKAVKESLAPSAFQKYAPIGPVLIDAPQPPALELYGIADSFFLTEEMIEQYKPTIH